MKDMTTKLKGKVLVGIIFSVLVLAGALLLPPLIRTAQAATSGEYEYAVNEDGTTATITGYTGAGGDITIPDTVTDGTNTYTVTAIGDSAFVSNQKITGVVMPNTVVTIGNKAFSWCYALTSVTLSDCISQIGNSAFNWCTSLADIILPDTVINIGDCAFNYCYKITSITIPNKVTSIGDRAFCCCGLTSIAIPNSVKSIGANAFDNCKLTSVVLGSGLISIGEYAFQWANIESIEIPSGVTSIGVCAFNDCPKLVSINVDASNNCFSSEDGVLFNKTKTLLIKYPEGRVSTNYVIPATVNEIGSNSMCCIKSLSSVVIPDSVTAIDGWAFSATYITSISIPRDVSSIGVNAFKSCPELASFSVDGENLYYRSQDGVVFNKDATELLIYPSGKRDTSYNIPDDVKIIGDYAFSGCAVKNVIIPDSVTSINDEAFSGCTLTRLYIPDSVIHIGDRAFFNCGQLIGISIPNTITNIGDYTFSSCANIKVIDLPTGLTSIGRGAFSNCSNLKRINIPETVTTIQRESFSGCSNLISAYFYGNAPALGTYAFSSCSSGFLVYYLADKTGYSNPWHGYTTVALDASEMPVYAGTGFAGTAEDYEYWVSNNEITITGYVGSEEVVSIPSVLDGYTVVEIGSNVFRKNSSILEITVPNSVICIGASAFSECVNLKKIKLPESVTEIGPGAFSLCKSLASIELPKEIKIIEDSVFWHCSDLKNVIIPDGVTSIGNSAFMYCHALSGITIPDSVTDIGNSVFDSCTSLVNIVIPQSVTNIGYSSFHSCVSLSKAYFLGDMPTFSQEYQTDIPFDNCKTGLTLYYTSGAFGFTNPWNGFATAVFDPSITYTISFDLNGATGTTPATQVVFSGMQTSEPTTPIRQNYYLAGWYTDSSLTDPWDFKTDIVTKDITLYAKWELNYCMINATSNNSSYGWVNSNGGGRYGNTQTLSAIPASGCRFLYWMSGTTKISTNAVYSFTVTSDFSITAYFAPIDTPTVTAISAGFTNVQLSWTAVEGAAVYQVWGSTSASGTFSLFGLPTSTTLTINDLKPGTTYYFKANAICSSTAPTYGNTSSMVEVKTSPATQATVAIVNYNSAYISWNAVPGASGYELSRSTSQNSGYSVVKTTSSLSYTNSSLNTGTTYYYRVRAYRTVGRTKAWGDYSAITSATPVLSSVTSASASAYYPTSIKVSWSAVPGRTKYEVLRSDSATGTYTRIGSTTSTYYKDTTCTPFITYYYQIKVYRTVNRLPIYSATASPTASATPILGNVSGVKAAVSSPSSVKISWASVTGASGYEVLRSTKVDGVYVSIKSTTSRSFTDTSCTPNTTYYYQVRAYRKVGGGTVPSAPSAAISATPYFGSISNAKAVRSSAGKIKLTWSAVSGRTGYEIYRRSSPDSDFVFLKNTTSTSFTDSGLTTGVTYEYKIVAYRTVNGVKYRSTESVVSATP